MTTLFWTSAMLACLALPENGDALELEPPLDPIAGTFAAVAYWRTEPAPERATFRLQDASGATVWEGEGPFDEPLRRAAALCDTSAFADGTYTLVAEAEGERRTTDLQLRQGRVRLHDTRPFRDRMLWMPMTGWTEEQVDDAVAAGYDTVFAKVAPPYAGPGRAIDFDDTNRLIRAAQERGMKVVVAWLLWVGLPPGEFYLENHDGTREPNRIDPCWDAAMAYIRTYAEQLLHQYMGCADVIALAPTWGIYGEAGYATFYGGYSEHALRKFNQWRVARGEPQLHRLPDPDRTYDNLLFHRFRFEHLAAVWGEFNGHIQRLEPNGIPIGAWQEIYNGHMSPIRRQRDVLSLGYDLRPVAGHRRNHGHPLQMQLLR